MWFAFLAAPEEEETVVESTTGVIEGVWEALGDNGYQTGTALIVATIALVVLRNLKVQPIVTGAVVIGAFWAGWLGFNTITGEDNQLFPGEVQATDLWDVAFTSDLGFLVVVIVACVLAVFLWKKGMDLPSRVVILVGGILGASLIYNIYESFQSTTVST
ncbi:MAG: hypothetical protein AAGD33_12355 [Actinomycetota bacterium]